MSTISAMLDLQGSALVFWLQLPLLVLTVAVGLAVVIALIRARKEDIPYVLGCLIAAFGQWPQWIPRRGNQLRTSTPPPGVRDEPASAIEENR